MKLVKKIALALFCIQGITTEKIFCAQTLTLYICNGTSGSSEQINYTSCSDFVQVKKVLAEFGEVPNGTNPCQSLCSSMLPNSSWANTSNDPQCYSGSSSYCSGDPAGYCTCNCTQTPTFSSASGTVAGTKKTIPFSCSNDACSLSAQSTSGLAYMCNQICTNDMVFSGQAQAITSGGMCTCSANPNYSSPSSAYNGQITYYLSPTSCTNAGQPPFPVSTSGANPATSPAGFAWQGACATYAALQEGYTINNLYVRGQYTSGATIATDFNDNTCANPQLYGYPPEITTKTPPLPNGFGFTPYCLTIQSELLGAFNTYLGVLCSDLSALKLNANICPSGLTQNALDLFLSTWKPVMKTDFVDLEGASIAEALFSQNPTLIQNALQYAVPFAINQMINIVDLINDAVLNETSTGGSGIPATCSQATTLAELIGCVPPPLYVDYTVTPPITYSQTVPTCSNGATPQSIINNNLSWYTGSCVQSPSYFDETTGITFYSTQQDCTTQVTPTTFGAYKWYPACSVEQNGTTYSLSEPTCAAGSSSTPMNLGTYTWYPPCMQDSSFTQNGITYTQDQPTCTAGTKATTVTINDYFWYLPCTTPQAISTGKTQSNPSSSGTPVATTKFAITAETSWPSAQTLKTKKEIICELGTINHKKVCMTTTAATCKNFSKTTSVHSSNPGCAYKATVSPNGTYAITNKGVLV